MNANTETDLSKLQAAIVADIQTAFPSFVTVEFDREEHDRQTLPMPACLLEMDSFEEASDSDPGTEQLAVDWRMSARLLLPFRTAAAKLTIRKLVAAFAVFLRLRRFTDPDDATKKLAPRVLAGITAEPDDFDPRLDRFEVWNIEFVVRMDLGASVWTDEGTTPSQVLVSWSPDIGPAHEDKYIDGIPDAQL